MADTRALYVISVAAELAGVHPQTLRIYERKGLLAPARTSGRSRRYSDHDIQLLRRIQELTNEGDLAGRACSGSWRSSRISTRARRRAARLEASVDALQQRDGGSRRGRAPQYRREIVPFAYAARSCSRRDDSHPK